jgi:hypothetical protein
VLRGYLSRIQDRIRRLEGLFVHEYIPTQPFTQSIMYVCGTNFAVEQTEIVCFEIELIIYAIEVAGEPDRTPSHSNSFHMCVI